MAEIVARPARAARRRRRSRAGTVALVAALLVMVAGAALFARAYTLRDAVLPGVSVAGVDIGGLSHADAQAKLQAELGPRLTEPVRIAVGEEVLVIRPSTAFALDVAATEERAYQAGRGSVLSRLGALVAPFAFDQQVEPVLEALPAERSKVNDQLRALTARPVNARLRMDGTEVVIRPGVAGTAVDVDPLLASVQAAGLAGTGRVTAAVREVAPAITTEEAEAVALRTRTLLASPVAVRLKKQRVGGLSPAELAGLVRFPQAAGAYKLALDQDGLRSALLPMVKTTLRDPKDATFRIVGQRVRIVRSRPGTTLDMQKAENAVLTAGPGPDGVWRPSVSPRSPPS